MLEASFARRFWAYLRERYDPFQFVPFLVLQVAAVGGLFRARYGVGWAAEHAAAHVALAALLLLFYFVLRVSDEHKDRAADLVAHPDRVLSRGLVTLGHLRRAAALAVVGMLGLGLALGPAVTAGVGVLLGYAVLMLREFFVGAWLRRRPLLYGVSHNVVVFLSVHLAFLGFGQAAGLGWATLAEPAVHVAALALNGLVFSLEVARKVRLPEAERAEVDTYSKALGVRASALLVPAVQAASLALLALAPFGLGLARGGALAVAAAAVGAAVAAFLRRPTRAGAERLVVPASAGVLAAFAVLATLGR